MKIKEPQFDNPRNLGATTDKPDHDDDTFKIRPNSKVTLIYKGFFLQVTVTRVEKEGELFVGRVDGFRDHPTPIDDLASGDHVRFRMSNIRWVP